MYIDQVHYADMFMSVHYRECLENALDIREELDGPKHPSVAVVLGSLGDMWDDAGNKSEAINFYQKALAIEKEVYGPNHLEVSYHSVIRILLLQKYLMLGTCFSKIK